MFKYTIILASILCLIPIIESNAEIFLIGGQGSSGRNGDSFPVTSRDGQVGDYEILICSSVDNGANGFMEPIENWSQVEDSDCAGSPDCILGIWGRFNENQAGEDNICRWNQVTSGAQLHVIRYSGVDPENPIVDSSCNSGSSSLAVAPSVMADLGAVVVRLYVGTQDLPPFVTPSPVAEPFPPDFDFANLLIAQAIGGGPEPQVRLFLFGDGYTVREEGDTGTQELNLNESGPWTACTLTLRMDPTTLPPPKQVPTLNVLGMTLVPILLLVLALIRLTRAKHRNA